VEKMIHKNSKPSSQSTRNPDLGLLSGIFANYPTIQAVYLFGSHVSEKLHTQSDLDLAIVPADRGLKEKKLDILSDLARVGFCDVDLVFLDTSDIVIKYEAIRDNRLIYQREDYNRGEIYSKVVRQYLDFARYLRVQREAYKRRHMNGSG
jgi:predicted nucleotidyltransferase